MCAKKLYALFQKGICEIEKAKKHNVPVKILNASSWAKFSKLLDEYFNYTDVIYISFYTKLLSSKFLCGREGYVFNCHPSILPACKGIHGFGDTLNEVTRYLLDVLSMKLMKN